MGPRAPGRKAEVEVPGARRAGGGGLRWPFRGSVRQPCDERGREAEVGRRGEPAASEPAKRAPRLLAGTVARREEKGCAGLRGNLCGLGLGGAFGPGARSGPVGSHRWFLPKVFRRVLESDGFLDTLAPTRNLALSNLKDRERGTGKSRRNLACRDATPKACSRRLLEGRSAPVAVKFAS